MKRRMDDRRSAERDKRRRTRSRSPQRKRSRSPPRRRSRSPVRKRPQSPPRRRSRSPMGKPPQSPPRRPSPPPRPSPPSASREAEAERSTPVAARPAALASTPPAPREVAPRLEKNQMFQRETDPHKLAQRQKQIDFGKNTIGYDRYTQLVPRNERKQGVHPSTPDKTQAISKRMWDGRVRVWRSALHFWDPETPQAPVAPASTALSATAHTVVPSTAPPKPKVGDASLFDDFKDETAAPVDDMDEDDLL
ncbi:hypothetical protein SPRG_01921 [Saprolegnia parasitica CBS 223.65]|uniref:Histone RNA hairpin-binding protein RNA-binding domain-containing protein n=1 Tax=Saprolegnia parasitica (strain CBS 223.65) TaxID=695850 RepID=A0A067CQY0_SAPPC|nr:hypothetical protein SPRG_01921 [Saprolegnia parasitica CBS 223.65]KDO33109.1 hypothetical protein SPRG_01921 [Saprolegnia parasitica CBS 223.65]|eukprot:XP_012195876.1 hypothetical protein SPRG_01921 [Saprolegnia parasitica CBS 223.65]